MIERLVPGSVATAETRDAPEVKLFDEEQRCLGRAVEKRRREFVTGRACARRALAELGIAPTPIVKGERGEPIWPAGVVGSITHCRGYSACAVAWADGVRSLGIDAEVSGPLPDGVLGQVAFGRERMMVSEPTSDARGTTVHLATVLFSAKEAVYKAWFPLTKRWLGFEDVELTINSAGETFRARLLVEGPVVDGARLTELRGRWCVEAGVVCTAVAVD